MFSENSTKVLYPNDERFAGKVLRRQQQYFFASCSLQDTIHVHRALDRPLDPFHEKWAVQLNDTHPAIAVAELMRLLMDKHRVDWDTAWHVTRHTFAYTNHTRLPEALEKWPVGLFGHLLPRHLEIICEINRRFLAVSNPPLAQLITCRVGASWLRDLDQLRKLESLAGDPEFQQQWRDVKLAAKRSLAALIEQRTGVKVNPESLFDIQAKRRHEYKRPHLKVLHILTLYLRLKRDPGTEMPPRTFVFGAKAAPGYSMAKPIIKLINSVADLVNHDPAVRDCLKVVFFPDYNVKNAQHVYPAADLSEQISTAGKEASGTRNMKFAVNGALTIGTLDGANVEIRQEVGAENFFLFGLTAEQVQSLKSGGYGPWDYYAWASSPRTAPSATTASTSGRRSPSG